MKNMDRKFCLIVFAIVALCSWLMSGCSDFHFVNAKPSDKEDPRELLRLVNPKAELTSGSKTTARLLAREAVYSDQRRQLELTTMTLYNFDSDGKVQGKTTANEGLAYFLPSEEKRRNRNDVELFGDVCYSTDDANTSDPKVHVVTNSLLWDSAAELFRGDTPFHGNVTQFKKKPMQMAGDNFTASRNMRQWVFKNGAFGPQEWGDLRALGARINKELETSFTQAIADTEMMSGERMTRIKQSRIQVPKVSAPQTMLDGTSTVTVPTVQAPPQYRNHGVPFKDASAL